MDTKILLVDPIPMFRDAVCALLEHSRVYEVVAAVDGGEAALEAISLHRPRLVVTEMQLPGITGIDLLLKTKGEDFQPRFLFLTGTTDARNVAEGFKAGAMGYVGKGDASSELLTAIRAVRDGHSYASASAIEHLIALASHADERASEAPGLTGREAEILRLVSEGMSSREIGGVLRVSARTVETHRANLMDKLGIHKVSGLVRYAIRKGLLKP